MTPLVLIPGMMCDARLWGPQMGAFGRRCVIHAAITEADRVEDLAAAVLDHAPARFALAGLSMGGIVAMEMVRQAPGRVERLALLDTNPRAEAPEVQAARDAQIQKANAGQLREVLRDEMKPNYLADGPGKQAILDLCMDMALTLGPEVFERQSRALASRPDQQDTLRAYTGPALVLMGEGDRLCPRDRHDLMHALMPHSRLVIVPRSGHLPTLEQPETTTAALLRWLED
ncbi:alpha/beta fold hydrolase [Anianabacter salinae]|uniref:alpha/beta fold hydrolase n=1 Tax=Anianabacter salinae TaxID=2851023 RepID=UPI00225E1816|nr:alpha/beta fold hydrolase [Anianabacter salinae]MBV0914011.1 alpha/beta hydrolase [Anianabacter salinae]